jgi:hypothetical protein
MDLFDNVWGDRSEVVVDHCLDVTLPVRSLWSRSQTPISQHLHQIALFVISVAGSLYPISVVIVSRQPILLGFGRRVTWTSDLVVPPGHRMTFKDALHISSTNLLVKISLPDWAKYLTKHTRKVDLAFAELKVCYFILSSKLF